MLILTIRTDQPEAEIGLYEDDQCIGHETWQAHRQLAETIHVKIETLLGQHGKNWQSLQGIVAFQGPGSFTGLRIGLSVANALAYGLQISIVAMQGNDWVQGGVKALLSGANQRTVVPEYGAPVHITKPKK